MIDKRAIIKLDCGFKMKRLFITTLMLFASAAIISAQTPSTNLKVGDRAPDFALPNGDGKLITLSEYNGRSAVVIVFYRGFW